MTAVLSHVENFSMTLKIALIGNGAIAKLVTQFCATRPERLFVVGALGLPADQVSVGAHPVVHALPDLQ